MTTMKKMEGLFPLGQLYLSKRVDQELGKDEVLEALSRHASGDWGLVGKEDCAANERALVEGSRLFSSYDTRSEHRIWIITEADRSATTVLFPNEY